MEKIRKILALAILISICSVIHARTDNGWGMVAGFKHSIENQDATYCPYFYEINAGAFYRLNLPASFFVTPEARVGWTKYDKGRIYRGDDPTTSSWELKMELRPQIGYSLGKIDFFTGPIYELNILRLEYAFSSWLPGSQRKGVPYVNMLRWNVGANYTWRDYLVGASFSCPITPYAIDMYDNHIRSRCALEITLGYKF